MTQEKFQERNTKPGTSINKEQAFQTYIKVAKLLREGGLSLNKEDGKVKIVLFHNDGIDIEAEEFSICSAVAVLWEAVFPEEKEKK